MRQTKPVENGKDPATIRLRLWGIILFILSRDGEDECEENARGAMKIKDLKRRDTWIGLTTKTGEPEIRQEQQNI
jgi:hypothetical protein